MKMLRRFGLPERLLAILLLVALIDFATNSLLFDRASAFALRQDDAARIAETLVVASRAIERTAPKDRPEVARDLSTPRFSITWSERDNRAAGSLGLVTLRGQVLEFAPELAHGDLQLGLRSLPGGGNVAGSMVLTDRSLLRFETNASGAWTLNAGRIVSYLLPTLVLAVLAWALFHATLRPLERLVEASRRVGSGAPRPLDEEGPDEVRLLIRAFNQMQQRIHRSLLARTQSMLAIGHDLRTPLARLQLRLENAVIDEETRGEMDGDIAEMRNLLESLQAFVETGGSRIPPERIDLAAMAATLVDTAVDSGRDATYSGDDRLEIMVRSVSIRRALSNLIDNALHYGERVRVSVTRAEGDAVVMVEDDGPGIPEGRLDDVLQPFVRLDNARSRDTPGMGLGLPIVRRAVKLENGSLHLLNRPGGGLSVMIRLPGAIV
ncbi:ATP-binding protein [Novosphingobium sp. KCTC 2891]|uniref:ATP-binding protein n=1 Tax=Novosphingobium sp. KCTC 2891 TaxID=2989730 RepID=UPI002221A5B2|nr:ATP-binding protein [Novosphingobium sp. KCTC 2891]MCW1383418.1 ATP-binding protein [Novosphingobium sp. KCTC 2891]